MKREKKAIVLALVFCVVAVLAVGTMALLAPGSRWLPSLSTRELRAKQSSGTLANPLATEVRRSPASSVEAGSQYEATTINQLNVVDEILETRNDNDARLDKELRSLSTEARRAFREKYRKLPKEKLNERGTLVFLLGRNLLSSEDFSFMSEVVSESPCLGLADCSVVQNSSDPHRDAGLEVTLIYVQLTAIKALEKQLGGEFDAQARAALQLAMNSKSIKIAQISAKLLAP